jgi:uncharacterized protein with FMN-binding domain
MYKKIIAGLLSLAIAGAIVLDVFYTFFGQPKATTTTNKNKTTTNSTTSSSTTAPNQYQDGTYTGEATETEYGDVQLKINVVGGKITTIDVLKYPNDERKSESINAKALLTYKQEALSAQSSHIQQVSGATETYKGFKGSLQDALNQAED